MAKEKVDCQEVYDLYQLCSETKDLREFCADYRVNYDKGSVTSCGARSWVRQFRLHNLRLPKSR